VLVPRGRFPGSTVGWFGVIIVRSLRNGYLGRSENLFRHLVPGAVDLGDGPFGLIALDAQEYLVALRISRRSGVGFDRFDALAVEYVIELAEGRLDTLPDVGAFVLFERAFEVVANFDQFLDERLCRSGPLFFALFFLPFLVVLELGLFAFESRLEIVTIRFEPGDLLAKRHDLLGDGLGVRSLDSISDLFEWRPTVAIGIRIGVGPACLRRRLLSGGGRSDGVSVLVAHIRTVPVGDNKD
jgi:hypothetical protein